MGMENGDAVVAVLAGIPGYVDGFKAAFPDEEDPLTFANVGKAIGAFERIASSSMSAKGMPRRMAMDSRKVPVPAAHLAFIR